MPDPAPQYLAHHRKLLARLRVEGVWTLPPTYRLKDKDRAKYEAIGESDRFTLKFLNQ